jgi:putative phage-type endonuclease
MGLSNLPPGVTDADIERQAGAFEDDDTTTAVAERDRSEFLGGSDSAAVMGLSPYATPVELWQQKTGRVPKPKPDRVQQKRFDRGHRLEPFIREMAIDKLTEMGLHVELVRCNERYTDPEHPFLSCEIDFELILTGTVVIGETEVEFFREHVNCDAKSVTGFARKKWGEVDTEDVPIEYAAQFMHGLMVTGRRYCLVAALRSFDDVDIFWTVRDDVTIAGMRPKLVSFWKDHVLADVPPDPLKFDDIKALFPLDNGLPVEADENVRALVIELKDVSRRRLDLEKAEDALKFEIAEFISPNSRLTFEGVDLMTWKGQNDTRIDNALIEAAEIYEPDADGQLVRIANPKARFSRTKVVRVLRHVAPKKGR